MIVKAISPWSGSKRTMAPKIVEALGQHRAYWEPFCGSMAVLLAKPKATMETVGDLHGDLVNLARTIQHPVEGPRLYRRARRTLFCEEFMDDSKAVIDGQPFEPTPERAYWFFAYSWLGRNGVIGSKGGVNFCVRYTSNGGQPSKRWQSTVASIPAWRRRLEGVTVLCGCGLVACERIEDKDGTVIYADPPYLAKGESYVHDFTSADHVRLAAALARFKKTRVVVSYYDHPRLAELYPGWRKLDVDVTKAMVSMGMRDQTGAVKAPEVLLINQE